MADVLAAYPLGIIRTILGGRLSRGVIRRLLLGGRVIGPQSEPEMGHVIPDPFERWLVERWLVEVRSPEFGESAEHEYLRAQWERSG